jgi:hypothetical protein
MAKRKKKCVCVRERKTEKERERGRVREREGKGFLTWPAGDVRKQFEEKESKKCLILFGFYPSR